MKSKSKYCIILFIGIATMKINSQEIRINSPEISFATGLNFTTYDYKNNLAEKNNNLSIGRGNFYEISYLISIDRKRTLQFQLGGTINEYNANGGDNNNIYSWESTYLGLKGGFIFNLLPSDSQFNIALNMGLNLNGIIDGDQRINGLIYDLTKQEEFKGLFLQGDAGISIRYNLNNYSGIGVGYQYSRSRKIENTTNEVLMFSNNQIQFRLHYEIF